MHIAYISTLHSKVVEETHKVNSLYFLTKASLSQILRH